jgi:hypothetical protein
MPAIGNPTPFGAMCRAVPAKILGMTQTPAETDASSLVVHRGRCHCGAVAFEVEAPAVIEALDCNCSICGQSGFVHLIVPRARFRLLRGEGALTDYRFGTGTAVHRFCSRCGIKSFYVPRSNPDGIDVNVRCLDRSTIAELRVSLFDDSNREASSAAIAHLSRDRESQ